MDDAVSMPIAGRILAAVATGAVVGTAVAVAGWWQFSLLPNAAWQSQQKQVTLGALLVGLVVLVGTVVTAELAYRAEGVSLGDRARDLWSTWRIDSRPRLSVVVSASAVAGATSVLAVVLVARIVLGAVVEDSDLLLVVTAAGTAALLTPARPHVVHALLGVAILAFCGIPSLRVDVSLDRLEVGAALLVVATVAAVAVWSGRRRAGRGERATAVLLVVVGGALVGVAPTDRVLADQQDLRALILEEHSRVEGNGTLPVFFFPQAFTAEPDGTVALLDRATDGRLALWTIAADGTATRLISGLPEFTAPSGQSLLDLPDGLVEDDVRVTPVVAGEPGDASLQQTADLAGRSPDGARPAVEGTTRIAFDRAGGLYGVDGEGLWRWDDLSGQVIRVGARFPSNVSIDWLATGDRDDQLMVLAREEDDEGVWSQTFRPLSTTTGVLGEAVDVAGAEGLLLAQRPAQQLAFVGLTPHPDGGWTTVNGEQVLRIGADGSTDVLAGLPGDPRPVDDYSGAGGRALLSYGGADLDDDLYGGSVLASLPEDGSPMIVERSLITTHPATDDPCRPQATGRLVVDYASWARRGAVLPDGTVLVLSGQQYRCLPTLWRMNAGEGQWGTVTTATQKDFTFADQDYAYRFDLGVETTGPVYAPTPDGRGGVSWVSPATGRLFHETSAGTREATVFPRGDSFRVFAPAEVVAMTSSAEPWYAGPVHQGDEDLSSALVHQDGSGSWRVVSPLDGITDLAEPSTGGIVVARCGQVLYLPADAVSTGADPATLPWVVYAGVAVPADGTSCPPASFAGLQTSVSAADAVVDPVSIAVVPDSADDGAPGGQAAAVDPGPLVVFADVGVVGDVTGARTVARIRVVGPDPEGNGRVVEDVPGGNLSDLGLLPVDIGVDDRQRICVATSGPDGAGPLLLLSDGQRRVVDLPGASISGCTWVSGRLVVTDEVTGDLIQLVLPIGTLPAGDLVPGGG